MEIGCIEYGLKTFEIIIAFYQIGKHTPNVANKLSGVGDIGRGLLLHRKQKHGKVLYGIMDFKVLEIKWVDI